MVKNMPANTGDTGDVGSIPGSGRLLWRRKGQPTPVFLPGESHGQRSLAGYSPWGCKESDFTDQLSVSLRLAYRLSIKNNGDFPGGPVAKTPCSRCRDLDSIPGQGTGPHMLQLKIPKCHN